jgi:hypothetical protein
MTTCRLVVGGNYCHWKTKTEKNTTIKDAIRPGFVSPWFVIVFCVVFSAIYLYFINSSATKGYQMKQIEKEITDLQKESEQLKIKEAELKSLYRIEEGSKNLNMGETTQVSFIEEKSPVAMR